MIDEASLLDAALARELEVVAILGPGSGITGVLRGIETDRVLLDSGNALTLLRRSAVLGWELAATAEARDLLLGGADEVRDLPVPTGLQLKRKAAALPVAVDVPWGTVSSEAAKVSLGQLIENLAAAFGGILDEFGDPALEGLAGVRVVAAHRASVTMEEGYLTVQIALEDGRPGRPSLEQLREALEGGL